MFLAATGVAAVSTTASCSGSARTARHSVVDTHAHVYPASYLDFLESHGVDKESTAIARNLNASDDDKEMSARLRQMDAAGVQWQILSATPQSPWLDDAAAAVEAARMVNDIYAGLIEKYPGRFKAYAAVPFFQPEEAIAETARALDELGFLGVAVNTLPSETRALTDSEFEPLFEELNRREAVLYIHPTGNAAFSKPMSEHYLTWVNAAPTEDTIAALHLLKADYINKYPKIKFHIAHLGGDLPFLAQRIEDNYEDWDSFPESPRESLKKMWFDAANFFGPSLVMAHDHVYDPNRILMGSDYPYFQEDKYARAVTYIQDSGLPESEVTKILSANARSLYGDLS